eukprot:872972-Pleurochrysis_carterae.AAC.1
MVFTRRVFDKECRLCGHHDESQFHLLLCPKLLPIRQFVLKPFGAMGTKGVTDNELTWLAGVHINGELLPSTHLAVIRLYWHQVYAAITRQKFDNEPLSTNAVQTSFSRTLYSRLLAHQHLLTTRFYRRRYLATGNYTLPATAADRFSPIGSIRLVDPGKMTIKATVLSILQQQGDECSDLISTNILSHTDSHNNKNRKDNNTLNFPIPTNIYYA